MLPLCERTVRVFRKNVAPVWTRSWPVAREPRTIGEHLKKRRFILSVRQTEAAQRLGVSDCTLSLWECDRIYPTPRCHPMIASYLGYDPFNGTGK